MTSGQDKQQDVSIQTTYRLHELVTITDRKDWLGFLGLFIGVSFLIIWALFGSVNTKVTGQGMLLKSSGINTVSSSAGGMLNSFNIKVGETVNKGDIIATITQDETKYQIEELKQAIESTARKNREKQGVRNIREANLLMRINDLNFQVSMLEQTDNRDITTENNLIDTREALNQAQNELEKITVESLEDAQALNALEREVQALQSQYDRNTKIISPYDGIIIDIFHTVGDIIKAGDGVVTIEQTGIGAGELEVVMFIPAIEGKKIHIGDELKLDLSNIKAKEFGFLKSKVKYVSPYPTTFKGMMRVIQNENVVREILKQGPQVEVVGALVKSNETPSGYEWTSVQGPPVTMQSGTFCEGEINVESLAPIELIFPDLW